MAALRERIEDEFHAEYGDDSPILREADTSTARLKLVRDVVEYVIAVESINISSDEKARLIERLYADLFGYGPLDSLLMDARITTIAILGANHAAVRYGHGELTSIDPLFEDDFHLRRTLTRLLADARVRWHEELPIVETGLTVGQRPVSISVVAPPVATFINADIRLHPSSAPSLDDLVDDGWMTGETADLLRRLAVSKFGFAVVGDIEAGKTTLLNALLPYVPQPERTAVVERAFVLRTPAGMTRYTALWGWDDQLPSSFGEQIGVALLAADKPTCIVLDEVRSDEPETIAPLLELDDAPRQIWAVRGVPDAKRLQSAMGMLARRAAVGMGERLVHALYERLPFVVTVTQIQGRLRVFSVAEWQSRVDTDYPDYVMLRRYQDGAARPTEASPARWLE
jgi:type IV secretory pathway ATPase VirB11/archaellum biosynthesis ATPase